METEHKEVALRRAREEVGRGEVEGCYLQSWGGCCWEAQVRITQCAVERERESGGSMSKGGRETDHSLIGPLLLQLSSPLI